jgi:hypothetical protein
MSSYFGADLKLQAFKKEEYQKKYSPITGFLVLTAVTMESFVFWEMILCSLKEVSRHFDQKTLLASSSGIFYDPEDGGNTLLRKDSKLLLDYVMSHPKRQYSSYILYVQENATLFPYLINLSEC